MEPNLRTIVTIAVRMKSKRLAKKAIAPIMDKPLIHHLVERVKKASLPSPIVVCTSHLEEDQILLQEASKCGVSALAGSPEDVFERFLSAAHREGAGHVVRVTGDNPLTDAVVMDRLIAHHLESHADYTTMNGLPLGVTSEVISVEALKRAQQKLLDKAQSEYMTFILKDSKNYKVEILEAEEKIRRPQYRLTVDTLEDLELMQMIFKKLYNPEKIFSLENVIRFLDQHPEEASINQTIEQRRSFDA